ncbi:hypothetical protein CERZMDRAFT_92013, partial [Cercospora zeae-maydis SCOH1-5]
VEAVLAVLEPALEAPGSSLGLLPARSSHLNRYSLSSMRRFLSLFRPYSLRRFVGALLQENPIL